MSTGSTTTQLYELRLPRYWKYGVQYELDRITYTDLTVKDHFIVCTTDLFGAHRCATGVSDDNCHRLPSQTFIAITVQR